MGGELHYDLMRPAPGWQRCCICFEARRVEELAVDENGDVWDVCKGDCAKQSGLIERGASDGLP